MAAIIKVILRGKSEKKKKKNQYTLLSKSAVRGAVAEGRSVGSARAGLGGRAAPTVPGSPRPPGSLWAPHLTPTITPLSSVQLGK